MLILLSVSMVAGRNVVDPNTAPAALHTATVIYDETFQPYHVVPTYLAESKLIAILSIVLGSVNENENALAYRLDVPVALAFPTAVQPAGLIAFQFLVNPQKVSFPETVV